MAGPGPSQSHVSMTFDEPTVQTRWQNHQIQEVSDVVGLCLSNWEPATHPYLPSQVINHLINQWGFPSQVINHLSGVSQQPPCCAHSFWGGVEVRNSEEVPQGSILSAPLSDWTPSTMAVLWRATLTGYGWGVTPISFAGARMPVWSHIWTVKQNGYLWYL